MDRNRNKNGSELFLVRLWLHSDRADEGDPGSNAWHGTVQHVLTGKAASFHDWIALTETFLEMMPAHTGDDESATSVGGATS